MKSELAQAEVARRAGPATAASRRAGPLTLTEQELFERLGWFTNIRWCVGLFCLLMLLGSRYLLGVHFRVGSSPFSMRLAVKVIGLLFLYNAVFTFLVHFTRTRGRITSRRIVAMALGQIVCDMIAVCALVHSTGGTENFFIILMLLPLVIATQLMPPALAYVTAGGAAVLINALAWGEQRGWIPHVTIVWPGSERSSIAGLYADPVYVLQVTAAITIMLFATVFIASAIASRLRKRELELEAAYRRLDEADEIKSFFMRKAGHDMRAPLAAIGGMLGAILATANGLSNEHRQMLGRVQHRTGALMALVADLRRYSYLHSAEAVLQSRSVRLGELVRSVFDLFDPQARGGGIEMACQADEITLPGDEELLRELVTNLVANAIQYTPSRGRIDVKLWRENGAAKLSVADTGIGISEQARPQLFREFYRAPEARNVFPDGTGLGLAICRRVAQMHGGDIEAASRPEGGSLFTVELPAAGEN